MSFGSAPPMRRLHLLALSALLAACWLTPAWGQAISAGSTGPALSRFDIFAGYAHFSPFASDIGNIKYPAVPFGADGSVAAYFGHSLGVEVEGNYAPNSPTDNQCIYTAQAGPIVRKQRGRLVPFFHALGGGAIVGGPRDQACSVWGWGLTGGFGFDVIFPVLHDHLALRPIQADFLYSKIDNGPLVAGGQAGGVGEVYAIRTSAGLVLRLGDMMPSGKTAPSLDCVAQPSDPFAGDPVTVTASSLSVSPKRKPRYLWSTMAGKLTGDGATAAIDTTGVAPGPYEVTGKLVEGDKQRLAGSCSTSFTVRAYQPPTLSCSADRAAINSGDPVVITAVGMSPQNRPLTYTYNTSVGLITANGASATLATTGTSPGAITVTCNVVDDHGQKASATAGIVVATPPPPPAATLPQMQGLCGITFDRDLKRPDRVDNEAKGCLDDVALALNRETGDKLLLVGSHMGNESNRDAAERAMNAAEYLTREKGIDPARLDLRIGPDASRAVAMMLLPPGATVDAGTATSFDTSSVKRTGQAYGPVRTAAATGETAHRKERKQVGATPR